MIEAGLTNCIKRGKHMFVDSTALVDFLRGKKEAVNIIEKASMRPLFTSEINVFELVEGVYASRENVQPHLDKIFALLTKMIVLPFDRKAALKSGFISGMLSREGKKIGESDCLIAGVALSNGIREIITENEGHFEKVKGLKVISY